MKKLWGRIELLVTGKAEWCDAVTGVVLEKEILPWRTRWAIAGIHSHNWKWVTKYGARDCGCTINPITRRLVLIQMGCPTHSSFPDCEDCNCHCCNFPGDDDLSDPPTTKEP